MIVIEQVLLYLRKRNLLTRDKTTFQIRITRDETVRDAGQDGMNFRLSRGALSHTITLPPDPKRLYFDSSDHKTCFQNAIPLS